MAEEDQINDYIKDLELQRDTAKSKNLELTNAINSQFGNAEKDNLVQWELDTNDILEKLEHFLRGSIIQTDEDGNVYYAEPKDKDLVILNDYGVNSIMQQVGNYVNRGITLSVYDIDRINEILGDIGDILRVFILCNYEKMGMDNQYKKSRYPMLVLNVLHIIESSFRKALKGKTLEETNTARIQVPGMIQPGMNPIIQQPVKRKRFLGIF